MSQLALVSIAVGALMIAVRGPLLVAPVGTAAVYRRLLASNAKIRIMGLLVATLGLAMILSSQSAGQEAAWFISILGWLFLLATVFLLVFTSFYRKLAIGMMDAVDDPAVLRFLGVIGTAFGAFLIYLGIGVF